MAEKTDFFYWTQPSKVVGHNVLTEIFTLVKTKRRRITIGRKERSICLISKKTVLSRSPHAWRVRVRIVYSKFWRLERSALPSSTGSYKTRGVTSPLLTFFSPWSCWSDKLAAQSLFPSGLCVEGGRWRVAYVNVHNLIPSLKAVNSIEPSVYGSVPDGPPQRGKG